jgi:hypothetical protein
MIGPMPGIVIIRFATGSAFDRVTILRSNSAMFVRNETAVQQPIPF